LKIIGIICEYNPFHLGHQKQINHIREAFGEDCGIVSLMSGNFVQRGMPAIFDKSLRAKAAVVSGADLVLELPVTCALSSAEGFAAGGVKILTGFCDTLCFGCESADKDSLLKSANALLCSDYPPLLRQALEEGISFPAARAKALKKMGVTTAWSAPNDILALEYCKAILQQESNMEILPIHRDGNYHAVLPDSENPSATAIRMQIQSGEDWSSYVPAQTASFFQNAPIYTLEAGERAMLARLRTMSENEFEALPYGSEGLWRKLMHNCRTLGSLDEIINTTKSKRYTRSRIDRMIMCAFLGISQEMLQNTPPYTRVLALNGKGKSILKKARSAGDFPHVGEAIEHPYWQLEQRCSDLYGLFQIDAPDPAGLEQKRRIHIQ